MAGPVFDTEKKVETAPTRQTAATVADRSATAQSGGGNQAKLRQQSAAAAKNPFENVKLRKDFPIFYGKTDAFVSNLVHDTFLGFEREKIVADHSYRELTKGGLQSFLKDIVKGELTSFEMGFIANVWGKDGMTTLIPIYAQNVGVFGYEIVEGGSGDRVHTVVTRLGEVVQEPYHTEAPLVNEGLGPLDYVIAGAGLWNVGKFLVLRALAKRAAKAALEEVGEETGEKLGEVVGGAASKAKFSPNEQQAIDDLVESGMARETAEELMVEQRSMQLLNGGPGTKGFRQWKPMGGY